MGVSDYQLENPGFKVSYCFLAVSFEQGYAGDHVMNEKIDQSLKMKKEIELSDTKPQFVKSQQSAAWTISLQLLRNS
jgi:hypothetical protein